MNITQISIDLAKNVFQVCCLNQACKPISSKKVSRQKLISYIDTLPRVQLCMEVCYTAHYWGRVFQSMGFDVCLIPAQHVKPFVRGNKNDHNDALAIAEAARRPNIRFVPVKSIKHQDLQMLQRVREQSVKQRTALTNQIRGIMCEYGVIVGKSRLSLQRELPFLIENAENELSWPARAALHQLYQRVVQLNESIGEVDAKILALCQEFEDYSRLREVPGIGPQVAAAILSSITDIHHFRNGRQLGAWLGLTPRQVASGEQSRMLGISKRGNTHLRTMLIHSARVLLFRVNDRNSKILVWADKLKTRRGNNTVTVALANKLARIIWALMYHHRRYNPQFTPTTPKQVKPV